MLKRVITFVDYDGNKRTEGHYFNLNKVELAQLYVGTAGGYDEFLKRIVDAKDTAAMLKVITDLVESSYGIKELDGKRFRKNRELTEAFIQSPAYEALFVELISNTDEMIKFVKGILPDDLTPDEKAAASE